MASLSSSIPTENDRLEPDKEEFRHGGPETGAWVSTDTALTLWLRGFTGEANNPSLWKQGVEEAATFLVFPAKTVYP